MLLLLTMELTVIYLSVLNVLAGKIRGGSLDFYGFLRGGAVILLVFEVISIVASLVTTFICTGTIVSELV